MIDDDREHHLVLVEPQQRVRVGQQDAGVEHEGAVTRRHEPLRWLPRGGARIGHECLLRAGTEPGRSRTSRTLRRARASARSGVPVDRRWDGHPPTVPGPRPSADGTLAFPGRSLDAAVTAGASRPCSTTPARTSRTVTTCDWGDAALSRRSGGGARRRRAAPAGSRPCGSRASRPRRSRTPSARSARAGTRTAAARREVRITRSGSGWPLVYRCSAMCSTSSTLARSSIDVPCDGVLLQQRAHRVGDLAPAAVADRDVDVHARRRRPSRRCRPSGPAPWRPGSRSSAPIGWIRHRRRRRELGRPVSR